MNPAPLLLAFAIVIAGCATPPIADTSDVSTQEVTALEASIQEIEILDVDQELQELEALDQELAALE